MLKVFFFFLRRGSSGFLAAFVKGRPNVNMTSFFLQKKGKGKLKRGGYKDPIRSHTRGSRQDNYKLYESTQQKVEGTRQKNGQTGVENYFSPLLSLHAPFNKGRDGRGWRRPSSGGILWLSCAEAMKGEGMGLLVFFPLIKAEHL